MLKKYSYKSIISFFLIISTILMPMSFLPKKAEAQLRVSGYTSGLAPAIARLPQCGGTALGAVKGLFNGIGDLFSTGNGPDGIGGGPEGDLGGGLNFSDTAGAASAARAGDGGASESLDSKASSLTIKAGSSPSAAETNKLLKETNKLLKEGNKTTKDINDQSSCIASIGRLIVKMLLQKLTLSTVNWINSGYDGSPSFLQDPGKFFGDIANNEILQFGIEIDGISPFSKEWMRNNALAVRNKFADNARYSLNEMIAATTTGCPDKNGNQIKCADAFSQDFSVGGWDAWTAMTQVPANNPLGAKLMFDNEIQKRLEGTSQSVAKNTRDALQAANGFLGDERCISATTGQINYSITKSEYEASLKETPPVKLCSGWTYVTPGKMVADAATTVMGYPNNSLLNVQDLNDAVAAISDAILNQFSTSIYEKGFANLDYQGIDGVLVFKDTNTDFRTQTEKDYIPSQLSSSWLQANPDFDIRTDLTQALIDEQRTYSDKLALQNKELMSTDDGGDYNLACPDNWTGTYPDCKAPEVKYNFWDQTIENIDILRMCPSGWTGTYPDCKGPKVSNAYGLMPAIYQLDYCIPGPHPGWEEDSRETLRKIVLPQEPNSSNDQTLNNVVGMGIEIGASFIPVVGPYVGPVLGSLFGAITGDAEAKRQSTNIRSFYTNQFNLLTGYQAQAVYGKPQDQTSNNMATSDGFFYAINGVLDRYINIMGKTYFSNPEILPPIANEAKKEFEQLPGYNQIIKDNKNKILEIKTTVSILGEIKDAVDKLNADYPDGGDEYESKLKAQINAFGRLSASMVNGDDIAAADDLAKQIVAKKDYIYKNLLKGPYGCEAFLENQNNIKPFLSANPGVMQTSNDWSNYNVNSVKRMTYPLPILYDYNNFAKGVTLPDPWKSGYTTDKLPKMPNENQYDKYGPGFLSFVYFSAIYDNSSKTARINDYNGSERLSLSGLINDFSPCFEDERRNCSSVSIGKGNYNPPFSIEQHTDGFFEKTIGIY